MRAGKIPFLTTILQGIPGNHPSYSDNSDLISDRRKGYSHPSLDQNLTSNNDRNNRPERVIFATKSITFQIFAIQATDRMNM